MSFLLRSASTMLLVLPSLLHIAPACGDTLPFTVKVSRVASPTLPEYFDPYTHPSPNGWATDFPVSSVLIDGEMWIIYRTAIRRRSSATRAAASTTRSGSPTARSTSQIAPTARSSIHTCWAAYGTTAPIRNCMGRCTASTRATRRAQAWSCGRSIWPAAPTRG